MCGPIPRMILLGGAKKFVKVKYYINLTNKKIYTSLPETRILPNYPKSEIGFMQTSVFHLFRLKNQFNDQESMSLSSHWHQSPSFRPCTSHTGCTSDTSLPVEPIRTHVPVGWFR
jgi:hypothetical protein